VTLVYQCPRCDMRIARERRAEDAADLPACSLRGHVVKMRLVPRATRDGSWFRPDHEVLPQLYELLPRLARRPR
jgi:hypothetical protein